MSVDVPLIVMLELDVFCTVQEAAVVDVSVHVQPKVLVEVHAVMLPTVIVPPESATVPHTMRGDACDVFEQVLVVPHV